MQTTYMAKPQEIERQWYIIDAAGRPLGRVATEVARLLRGKHKAIYTPHIDTGDHVIVLNASRVVLTGKKLEQKNSLPPFRLSRRFEDDQLQHDDGQTSRKSDVSCC